MLLLPISRFASPSSVGGSIAKTRPFPDMIMERLDSEDALNTLHILILGLGISFEFVKIQCC